MFVSLHPEATETPAQPMAVSAHPLLTTWVSGLAHQVPAFPRLTNEDIELFRGIDLNGTGQAHDERLVYSAVEQMLREVALPVLEEAKHDNHARGMRSLLPMTSPTSASKALEICFAVPQGTAIHQVDRCTLIMSTVTCAVSALPTENWFYAMSNAGTTAAIYIKTARRHAHALTQIYESFFNLVTSTRMQAQGLPA